MARLFLKVGGALAVLTATVSAPTLFAQEVYEPNSEYGLLLGVQLMDENLTGLDESISEVKPLFGLRAAYRLSDSFMWFVDTTYARHDTIDPDEQADYLAIRTGPEIFLSRQPARSRFFISLSTGLEEIDPTWDEPFRRSFASLGFGQRFVTANRNTWRWELRADRSLTNTGLEGAALNSFQFLIGWAWGVGGGPRDSDNDGVVERHDKCPCTPPLVTVDDRGCPVQPPAPPPPPPPPPIVVPAPPPPPVAPPLPRKLILRGVNFASDSAELTPGSLVILDRVAESLRDWPDVRVRIDGHTDSTNTEQHNQDLSERRVQSVRLYLISKGIDPSRMETKGWGESQPIADNATIEGRAINRRVELIRIDTADQ